VSAARSHRVEVDGLRLHVESAGVGPDVVLLHGFTGSTHSMREAAAALAPRFRTLCVDLVGHGRSDAPDALEAYAMPRCARQVAGVLEALAPRGAHLFGYSMGGRVALALCAARPERVKSALLVGASAGIADADARAERRQRDAALAERIEREGVPPFVDAWMAQPLFESQRRRLSAAQLAAARAQRLDNRARGLANSLRGMGSGAQEPLHDALARIHTPVCLVAGEDDARFRAIAADLAGRLPAAQLQEIPEAGHAAHLENPRAFLGVAAHFFDAVEAALKRAPARREHPSQPREVTT
jgi:2-succinyl-6-hydroxy-2,4-cyclohexadiene-1-carboxylate synthase